MSVNEASRIVFDDSRVALQIMAPLTDNSRFIIYDHNMFIVQPTLVVLCISQSVCFFLFQYAVVKGL
jgi:hypothetical protein